MMRDRSLSIWIDVLKGIAILEIAMFHFFGDQAILVASQPDAVAVHGSALTEAFQNAIFTFRRIGGHGIHVFFFMSGVGLALSELNRQLPPWTFLRRRLSRIYPAYFLAVLFVMALQLSFFGVELDRTYLGNVLPSLLLISTYSERWIAGMINGNWWFISSIVAMYCLYSLLKDRIRARPVPALAISLGCSFTYKVSIALLALYGVISFDASRLNPYTAFFLNHWWEFVAGAAFVYLNGWERLNSAGRPFFAKIMAIGAASYAVGICLGYSATGRVFNDDFFAIGQLLFLSGAFLLLYRPDREQRVAGLFAALGASSYGLYLIHHPISRTLLHFEIGGGGPGSMLLLFAAYFCAVFCIGWLLEKSASRLMGAVTQHQWFARTPISNRGMR